MNKPLILHVYQLPTNIKLNNHGYKNKHNWVRFTGTKEVVTNTKKIKEKSAFWLQVLPKRKVYILRGLFSKIRIL